MSEAEKARRVDADTGAAPWRAWGPYLAERAWGTVREDFSDTGASWDYFPHDHARSRAYRWSEDGLGGICDDRQTWCFAVALWNGRDTIVKERIFGLGGPEGNHGEDAKEYWWYLDSTPTHSWMTWRYHYPQGQYPYSDLVLTTRTRGRSDPEYNLVHTGIFADDRYWAVTVDYAKADPTDMCIRVRVANRGPETETLHLLPTLWFRNTWIWEEPGRVATPEIRGYAAADGPARLVADHAAVGRLVLAGEADPEPLACDNQTNERRLTGGPTLSHWPKDAIGDHVTTGADTVNPDRTGSKAALHYVLEVPAGETREIRLRLRSVPVDDPGVESDLGDGFAEVMAARQAEADEYYAGLMPAGLDDQERHIFRQAIAGLEWSKVFYNFDVARWLAGDPVGPQPSDAHRFGRNAHWTHMRCRDIMLVPDPWEYPWYAAWDLAFHCVAIARADPAFAKGQVLLLMDDRYMHRNGALPAYEWAFDDVNPPVQAWAALRVFEADGEWDYDFLSCVLHKLLLNFGWWVNRKDPHNTNVFTGGFLGLDNIAPFDRSAPLPIPGELEQADASAWMAAYSLHLMRICLILARRDRAYVDLATKFADHFAAIGAAMYARELWHHDDAAFYDVVRADDGRVIPLAVRTLVGLIPLVAAARLSAADLHAFPEVAERLDRLARIDPVHADLVGAPVGEDGAPGPDGHDRLLAVIPPDQLRRVLAPVLDEQAFLSPYGIRSVPASYRHTPYKVMLGDSSFSIGYEPGDSHQSTFGGNSNWRGPVWFPANFLLIEALRTYGAHLGDEFTVEFPTGSGVKMSLSEVADAIAERLISLFRDDDQGRRPVFGDEELFQTHPDWHDLIPFHEYYHGDTGTGLGASHQTGWTALVAELIHDLRVRKPRG